MSETNAYASIELNLPSSEQLEHYYQLRQMLQTHPKEVSPEQLKAFCTLALGMSPDLLNAGDIELIQKLRPEEWQKYCEWHWGTAEEQRGIEEARLLNQGYVRGEDGKLHVPWP